MTSFDIEHYSNTINPVHTVGMLWICYWLFDFFKNGLASNIMTFLCFNTSSDNYFSMRKFVNGWPKISQNYCLSSDKRLFLVIFFHAI